MRAAPGSTAPDICRSDDGGDRRGDASVRNFVSGCVDFLGAAADEALGPAQVAIDVGIEQLDEQPIQFRMDEPGLRQQSLGRRLVIRLRLRRELRIDLDAAVIAVTTAWMDGQTFEIQEDLDVVLRELDAQLLVAWICGAL